MQAEAPKVPYVGSRISLISKSGIRYVGTLYTIDTKASTVALKDVKSFGTEGRHRDAGPVQPSDQVFSYIIFRGPDIMDLQFLTDPVPTTTPPTTAAPVTTAAPATTAAVGAAPVMRPSPDITNVQGSRASTSSTPPSPPPHRPQAVPAVSDNQRRAEPMKPAQPVSRVQPFNHVQPVNPVQPVSRVQPIQPVNHIEPVNHVQAGIHFPPGNPGNHVESGNHVQLHAQPQQQRTTPTPPTPRAWGPPPGRRRRRGGNVPDEDFDFESMNRQFEKAVTLDGKPVEKRYDKSKSFFDSLVPEKEMRGERNAAQRRATDLETFGEAAVRRGRRGRGRGRGRGRRRIPNA